MNGYILQEVINVVFTQLMPYVIPLLFLFMVALFSERLIDIVINAVSAHKRR